MHSRVSYRFGAFSKRFWRISVLEAQALQQHERYRSVFFVILILGVNARHIAADALQNHSFETPTLSDHQWTVRNVPGWSISLLDSSAGAGIENHPDWVYPGASEGGEPSAIPDGRNVMYLTNAEVSQQSTLRLSPNTSYSMVVDVGQRLDLPTTNEYSIELWAGSRLVAKESSTTPPAPGTFEQHRIQFETGDNYSQLDEPISVRLSGLGESVPFAQVNFDNVQLTSSPGLSTSYAIDSAKSFLTLSGSFGDVPAYPQQQGANVARYNGSLHLDFDSSTNTIRFNGGSVIDADENPASLAPGPGNTPAPAPADYGLAVSLAPTIAPTLAIRDFQFDLNSPAIQASVAYSDASTTRYEFDSRGLQLFMDGHMDYSLGPFGGSRADLGGLNVQNQSATQSSVTVTNTPAYQKTVFSLSIDASLSSTFAVGSTPLPLEARLKGDIVATSLTNVTPPPPPPARIESPSLPTDPVKTHLIVVTHGMVPPGSDSPTWHYDLADDIKAYVNMHTAENAKWLVVPWDWSGEARTLPRNAQDEAESAGMRLARLILTDDDVSKYEYIHLIGHSAGANLIATAANIVDDADPATVIHTTFLDAFTGGDYYKQFYGQHARSSIDPSDVGDWADHYFNAGDLPGTEATLNNAYNVNVSSLFDIDFVSPDRQQGYDEGSGRHSWPIDFYWESLRRVQDGDNWSDANGLGFPVALEAGFLADRFDRYPPGMRVTPDESPEFDPFPAMTTTSPLAWEILPIEVSNTGSIDLSQGQITMTTGSPVWTSFLVDLPDDVFAFTFQADFISSYGAEGLLSVYMDNELLRAIDERFVPEDSRLFRVSFDPSTTSSGDHLLSFRLDPYTDVPASVRISDIRLVATVPEMSSGMFVIVAFTGFLFRQTKAIRRHFSKRPYRSTAMLNLRQPQQIGKP